MNKTASYHNVRDKNGRFTSKGKKSKGKVGIISKKKVNTKALEIYEMFILDKSGSMKTVRSEAITGFNNVLKGIKDVFEDTKVPSYCSLIQFDYPDKMEVNYLCSEAINTSELNTETYKPRGNTALYDAIAFGINKMRDYLGTKSSDKKIQVTVTVLTDGYENASREYNSPKIKALITEMRDSYNWTINFIGAGEDSIVKNIATNLGFFASNTMSFTADGAGTTNAFNTYTNARNLRSTSYASSGEVKNDGFFSNEK